MWWVSLLRKPSSSVVLDKYMVVVVFYILDSSYAHIFTNFFVLFLYLFVRSRESYGMLLRGMHSLHCIVKRMII